MNQSKQSVTRESSDWLMLGVALVKGLVISFFLLQLLLFASAIGISQGIIGEGQMKGAVIASVFLSALCGAVFALSQGGKRGLFVGILLGGMLFLLLFFLGYAIYPQISMANGGLELLFACFSGGAVAKFLVKKKKKTIKNSKKS